MPPATVLDVQGLRVQMQADATLLGQMLHEIVDYFGLPAADDPNGDAAASLYLAARDTLPPLPTDAHHTADYGQHVRVWRSGAAFILRSAGAFIAVAPEAGRAVGSVLVRDDPALRSELLADVVLALFLLLRPHGFFPLHAAALVHDEQGVLLAAESDSGKSTTAYNLVRQGWSYLSDDSVLLHPTDGTIEAVAFRRNFGMDPDAQQRFPEIAEHWTAQLTDVDKRCIPMEALYPDQAVERCTPRLLVFPELVKASESRLVPLRRSEALLRLIAQSALVTLTPDWTPDHLDVLKRLLDQAPPYRLLAAPDLLRDPTRTAALLEAAWSAPSSSTAHG